MLYTQDLEVIRPDLRGEYFKIVNAISRDLNGKWNQKNYKKETMSFDTFSEAYDFAGQLVTGVAMKLRSMNIPKKDDPKGENKFLKGRYVLNISTSVRHEDKYIVHFEYN